MQTSLNNQMLSFWQEAKRFTSYEPSSEVNCFFSQLCQFARQDFDDGAEKEEQKPDFNAKEIKELQAICAIAEEKMEKFWSKKITQASDARKALSAFTYYRNYEQLTSLEYQLLLSQLPKLEKVLFVGSGALPLTAILLAKKGVKAVLIERDQEAFDLSQNLIEKLNLKRQIEIIKSDFLDFFTQEKFDAVRMASLLFTA